MLSVLSGFPQGKSRMYITKLIMEIRLQYLWYDDIRKIRFPYMLQLRVPKDVFFRMVYLFHLLHIHLVYLFLCQTRRQVLFTFVWHTVCHRLDEPCKPIFCRRICFRFPIPSLPCTCGCLSTMFKVCFKIKEPKIRNNKKLAKKAKPLKLCVNQFLLYTYILPAIIYTMTLFPHFLTQLFVMNFIFEGWFSTVCYTFGYVEVS